MRVPSPVHFSTVIPRQNSPFTKHVKTQKGDAEDMFYAAKRLENALKLLQKLEKLTQKDKKAIRDFGNPSPQGERQSNRALSIDQLNSAAMHQEIGICSDFLVES